MSEILVLNGRPQGDIQTVALFCVMRPKGDFESLADKRNPFAGLPSRLDGVLANVRPWNL